CRLPVDAPEGDPGLALRQRVRVHEGQRAHRERSDPSRAVAYPRLRGRRGSAPADARKQAPGQDLDPRRRGVRGPGQDGRWTGRDPRGGGRVSETVPRVLERGAWT